MPVLATGGAGFIGSHLVDRLMAEGHEVTAIDDLSVGTNQNVAHHLDSDRFRFVTVPELLQYGRPQRRDWYKTREMDWLNSLSGENGPARRYP